MSISVPYSTAHHDGWLFSETLTVSGGFVHIITRIAEDEDALETEITEHRFTRDGGCFVCFATLVRHRKLALPFKLSLQLWHEHMLACHQALYRERPLPYCIQVAASLGAQLTTFVEDLLLALSRRLKRSSF